MISDLYIPGSLSWAEGETARSIAIKQYRWSLAGFPTGNDPIRLPMGKAASIVSIVYVANGQTVTLRGPTSGSPIGTDFQEDLSAPFGGLVMPNADEMWPTTDTDVPAPVVITFTAGWAAADVPADLKLAMLRYISEELDMCDGEDANMKNVMVSGWKLR